MSLPLVSVIIPTYNRAEMISSAIDSVLEQDFSDYEIIVSDDGSNDKTQQILLTYRDRIRVVSGPNGGCGVARARAIDIAKGKYIANHDSDDIMLQNRLILQSEFMEAHQNVVAVTGNLIIGGNEDVDYLKKCGIDFCGNTWIIIENAFPILMKKNFMSDPATMFRKECYNKIGGYDTLLPISLDWDLWLRMSLQWPLACINTPCTFYRAHKGNISASPHRISCNLRVIDKAIEYRKNCDKKEKGIIHNRLFNMLKQYIEINLFQPFESDWRGKALHYGRHLSWPRKYSIAAISKLPDEIGQFIVKKWKMIKNDY